MKDYRKPKLLSFSRSYPAVPAAIVAALPAVTAAVLAVNAVAKAAAGDKATIRDVDSLIPVEVI